MRCGLKLPITSRKSQIQQSGYVLITLMLAMTLAAIAALAILPSIKQQIQRDQEEEMCHRGTQYMRAIQHFYKKFGRYPTRVEELEDTNKMRFLRKRYKDPLLHDQQGHEKDFKLLHMQDISMNNGPMLGQSVGGQVPTLGQGAGQNLGLQGGAQQLLSQVQQQGGAATGLSSGAAGNNETDAEEEPNSQNPQGGSSSNSGSSGSNSSSSGSNSSSGFNSGSTTGTGLNGTVFGGGPILGVASTSKQTTIREYNKKNHYNDWIFVYDPTSDTGGLLVGPWQTPQTKSVMPGATPAGQMPGAQQGFGQGQGLGQGFGGQSQGPQPPTPQQPPQNQDNQQ